MVVRTGFLILLLIAAISPLSGQVASDSVCSGDAAPKKYFVSNPEPGTVYNWTLNGGGSVISQTNDTLAVTWGNVSGLYSISVTGTSASGCSTPEVMYWINILQTPVVTVIPEFPVICIEESIELSASGAASYTWSPTDDLSAATGSQVSAFPSATTTYTVTGMLGACNGSGTVTVTVDPFPEADFTYIQTGNYIAEFENTTSDGTTFEWIFEAGNTSNEENPVASFPFEGTYPVTLITTNSCGSDTITKDVLILKVGFLDLSDATFEIGPNPFQDFLRINLSLKHPQPVKLAVYDLVGKQVHTEFFEGGLKNDITLNLSQLAMGMYLVQLNKGAETINIKVLKE